MRERGEVDARGPWNQGEDIEYVEAPAQTAAALVGREIRSEIDKSRPQRARAGRE